MPSKNDLSALKKADPKPILPNKETKPDVPLAGKKRAGRKPSTDKRSYKVMLSLTEGQGAKLEEKAGLANSATVVYDHLIKTGFFD